MGKLADRIILVLNALAGAVMLFSYLAPLVNPSRFFLPALFGLAYPYLLLVNLLFLCYWLIRLKKEILISLIVIIIGWNHLNNLAPFRLKPTELPSTIPLSRLIKVLSYNVRAFDIYHWTKEQDARKEIFRFIEEQEPDILCLQEYYTFPGKGESHSEISRKLISLPESAVYYSTDNANRYGLGIATFSRYPILRRSRIPLNSTGNAAMYTDILFRSDTVRVFNIHLQSIRFRQEDYDFIDTVRLKYSYEQLREIREIGTQLKRAITLRADQADMISNYIEESPYPVIVMGDFNDTPQSYAYRKIRKGLSDAFRKAGRGFGNTYSGDLPSFRIDYILFSDPFTPYEFERIKAPYSDHFPVTTSFYLPEGPASR